MTRKYKPTTVEHTYRLKVGEFFTVGTLHELLHENFEPGARILGLTFNNGMTLTISVATVTDA